MPNLDMIDGGIRIFSSESKSGLIKTEIHWIRLVLLALKLDPHCVENWYSAWILLHSSLIRFAPINSHQQKCLGLKFNSIPARSTKQDRLNENLNRNDVNFPFIMKHPLAPPSQRVRSELFRIIQNLRDMHVRCTPTFNFRDFGPLGPSFRGRDNIRRLEVNSRVNCNVLMTLIKNFNKHCDDTISKIEDLSWNPQDRFYLGASMDLEWMYDVHNETYKTRPMTVDIPSVQFQVFTYG